jgi:hypothetical protein
MSIFKKQIDFGQFITEAISSSINFYDANFDKLIPLADEFHVLTEEDKKELRESGYALIIADLMVSCRIHFGGKISNEQIGRECGFIYVVFLRKVKHLNKNEIDRKTSELENLLTTLEKNEDKETYRKVEKTEDGLKFLLCSSFAELYSGDNLKDRKVEGKRFAAFKLAKAIVKTDLVRIMLKEFKIKYAPMAGDNPKVAD